MKTLYLCASAETSITSHLLLEIAQGVFDTVRDKRFSYIKEIQQKEQDPNLFLAQALDFDTLLAYSEWKFPYLKPSYWLTELRGARS